MSHKTVGCFRYCFCKLFGHDDGKNSLKKERKKEKNIMEKRLIDSCHPPLPFFYVKD